VATGVAEPRRFPIDDMKARVEARVTAVWNAGAPSDVLVVT
jgi:hypothetical protein